MRFQLFVCSKIGKHQRVMREKESERDGEREGGRDRESESGAEINRL